LQSRHSVPVVVCTGRFAFRDLRWNAKSDANWDSNSPVHRGTLGSRLRPQQLKNPACPLDVSTIPGCTTKAAKNSSSMAATHGISPCSENSPTRYFLHSSCADAVYAPLGRVGRALAFVSAVPCRGTGEYLCRTTDDLRVQSVGRNLVKSVKIKRNTGRRGPILRHGKPAVQP